MEEIIIIPLLISVYAVPSIVGGVRHHPSIGGIIVLNLLLGWTIIGWIGALVWAASRVD